MDVVMEFVDTLAGYTPLLIFVGVFFWWLTWIQTFRKRIGVDEESRKHRGIGEVNK